MSQVRFLVVFLALAACGKLEAAGPDGGVDAPSSGLVTYHGTLDSTAAAPFGGAGTCNYTITLKQVEVTLGLAATGQVVNGSAQALAIEAAVPPCSFPPIDPNVHKFTLIAATAEGQGQQLTFTGNPANSPNTSLVMNLQPSGGNYLATATWHRIDQVPPLDWTLGGSLTLTLATSLR